MDKRNITVWFNWESRVRLARSWGRANGYKGNAGGWIYRAGSDRAVCQGWLALYHRKYSEIWEAFNAA